MYRFRWSVGWKFFSSLLIVGVLAPFAIAPISSDIPKQPHATLTVIPDDSIAFRSSDGEWGILKSGHFVCRFSNLGWQLLPIEPLPFQAVELKHFCFSPQNPWRVTNLAGRDWELDTKQRWQPIQSEQSFVAKRSTR